MLDEPYEVEDRYTWLLRSRFEYADNFDSIQHYGGQVLWDTALRIGLDSEFNYRRETLGAAYDSLWTGDHAMRPAFSH